MSASSKAVVLTRGLTKDYGEGRGIFGVDLEVEPGEVLGFLGPNGAGKTVTMRHLMGFVRPQAGSAEIFGLPCFERRAEIQSRLGYLPGESAAMREMTAAAFLGLMADMRGLSDRARMGELIEEFELDARARIRDMSKGNRQKVAIVAAFMSRPEVLLLDEPTSGLDPLMQERFMALVTEERNRGAAILLSSHIFEEVERTCDRVAFIRAGRVAEACSMDAVRRSRGRSYRITFSSTEERSRWDSSHGGSSGTTAEASAVTIEGVVDANALIRELAGYDVRDLVVREQTLEDVFLGLYGDGASSDGDRGGCAFDERER